MDKASKRAKRPRRSFTPEFKAEAVRLCQIGDRTISRIASDFKVAVDVAWECPSIFRHANAAEGIGERAKTTPPRGRRSPMCHNVARHSYCSTALLDLSHGTAASQWICRARARRWKSEVLSITFERAGVSTIARLADGRLIAAFQNFPSDDQVNFDRAAASFSSDEGVTWTKPAPIVVEGMTEGLMRPFDPTLVVLDDGRVRIYFTSNRNKEFAKSTPEIYSAIGTDGINYTFEPGVRFAIEGRGVIDCAVVRHKSGDKDQFYMFVPDNGTPQEMKAQMGQQVQQQMRRPAGGGGEQAQRPQARKEPAYASNGYHATSSDGLTFTRVADVKAPERSKFLGCAVSDGEKILFFGTGPAKWPLTSEDGVKWTAGKEPLRVEGADPGAVRLKNGDWLVTMTSRPVRGGESPGK